MSDLVESKVLPEDNSNSPETCFKTETDATPENVFSQQGANVPEIRFNGFNQGWIKVELNQIAKKATEKNLSNSNLETFTNSAEYGIVSQRAFFDFDISNSDSLNSYFIVRTNDFVYNPRISTNAPCGPINRNKLERQGVVSPIYTVFRFHDVNLSFMEWFFKGTSWHTYMKFNSDIGARSDRFSIKNDSFFRMPILTTNQEEQRKIGTFFDSVSAQITLNQQEINQLQAIKNAMLEKMFPQDGADVPEIRFAGYNDKWVRRNLTEVLMGLKNTTFSRAELSLEKGTLINIHYGDILVKFGATLDVSSTKLPYVKNEAFSDKLLSYLLQDGDVIVADTAEDSTVGKCTELMGINEAQVIAGLHTIPYRPILSFAPGFLGYFMNSPAYHNQLIPFMQGIKVTSVSKSALKKTNIIFPTSTNEQRLIGEYFKRLDSLIELKQQTTDKLQSIKQALLAKMFV